MGKYDDIINLPHHVSTKHPRMSLEARSAQFAPFAALTGFEDAIIETGRLTSDKEEISDVQIDVINKQIQILKKHIKDKPIVSITYFIPDSKKTGGRYATITGVIKKIDEYNEMLLIENGTNVPINEIAEISADIFEQYDIEI